MGPPAWGRVPDGVQDGIFRFSPTKWPPAPRGPSMGAPRGGRHFFDMKLTDIFDLWKSHVTGAEQDKVNSDPFLQRKTLRSFGLNTWHENCSNL